MKVIGDITVHLPYNLDFCAMGPEVPTMAYTWNGTSVVVHFPPSMSEGTVGQSFFASGWAWWTGSSVRLVLQRHLVDDIDVDSIRSEFVVVANRTLRKLLNAYRSKFNRPDVFPVLVESKNLTLTLEYPDGRREMLPEPSEAFFYRHIPEVAPLTSSINSNTIEELTQLVASEEETPMALQLELDAQWLETLGEFERAKFLRHLKLQDK